MLTESSQQNLLQNIISLGDLYLVWETTPYSVEHVLRAYLSCLERDSKKQTHRYELRNVSIGESQHKGNTSKYEYS